MVHQLVEHVLLVYVIRVEVHHRRRSSSGTKTAMGQMPVEDQALGGISLGDEAGLIYGGNALCKGRKGGDVGLSGVEDVGVGGVEDVGVGGVEGLALDRPRKWLVARIWRVTERVELRGLVECEDD